MPIVLVAVYAGRREWARAAWTLAITAALVLPALAFDLSGYPRDIGAGQLSLLTVSPLLFGVVAAVRRWRAAYRWAGTRWAWLLGSLAMMLALPRFLLYEISFATVGLAEDVPAGGGGRCQHSVVTHAVTRVAARQAASAPRTAERSRYVALTSCSSDRSPSSRQRVASRYATAYTTATTTTSHR